MITKRMIWLLVVMGLLTITAVVWAQDEEPVRDEPVPIGADGSAVPFTINAGGATCSEATTLFLPGGDSTDVSAAGNSADDPILSCMWGNPERRQGYRTIWYKFVSPYNGLVRVSTLGSQYDTVLAIHAGTCTDLPASLNTLTCNDDTNGFSSEVSLNVIKGQTYYVEVADWHQAVDDPTLNLSIILDPLDSKWELLDLMTVPLSRHTAVATGGNILVLGGQDTNVYVGSPSKRLLRYNTATDTWDNLAPMPGETGYAHAAAVFYRGKMYVPGGVVNSYYDANDRINQDVDDTHWVYTPEAGGPGSWQTAPPAWPNGSPWTWTATVASADPQKLGYYLIGGISSPIPLIAGADVRSEVLFYSTFSHDWHNQPPMEVNGTAVPRYGHTAVWLPGKGVCVTGGLDSSAVLIPQGMCLNPTTETWSSIAAMRQPRYGASSAVGPDGRWYVFGGIGTIGNATTAIATTEVYDPNLNTWISLNVPFDLGGGQSLPARGWLQVKWANDHFWAIGGEQVGSQSPAPLPMVEKLYVPPENLYLPFTIKPNDGSDDSYDNFARARRLSLNVTQEHNFDNLLDFVDVFYFDLPTMRQVRVRLTDIPQNNNYDIAIYGQNKLLWGEGHNLTGQNENVVLKLPAGRYFIVVERVFPLGKPNPNHHYRVRVEG